MGFFLHRALTRDKQKWITRYEREELVNETEGNSDKKSILSCEIRVDGFVGVCVCVPKRIQTRLSIDRQNVGVRVRVRVCVMPYSYNSEPNTLLFYCQILFISFSLSLARSFARPRLRCADVGSQYMENITSHFPSYTTRKYTRTHAHHRALIRLCLSSWKIYENLANWRKKDKYRWVCYPNTHTHTATETPSCLHIHPRGIHIHRVHLALVCQILCIARFVWHTSHQIWW